MSPTNDGKSPVYDVKNPVTDQGSRVVVYKALHTIKRALHIPETSLDAKFAWVFLCVCVGYGMVYVRSILSVYGLKSPTYNEDNSRREVCMRCVCVCV